MSRLIWFVIAIRSADPCAESRHLDGTNDAEAFQTGVKLFNELRQEADPDHVTFGNLLRCANLLAESEKKNKFVQATFKMCCERGLVNKLVLRDLKDAASDDLWISLTSFPPDIDVQEEEDIEERLPLEWRRNMKKKEKPTFANSRGMRNNGY